MIELPHPPFSVGSARYYEYLICHAKPVGIALNDVKHDLVYAWLHDLRPRGFWRALGWTIKLAIDLLCRPWPT